MSQRAIVTLAMLASGVLIVRHFNVPAAVGASLSSLGRAGTPVPLALPGEAGRWLLAYLTLFVLLLALVDVGGELASLAAILAALVAVATLYRWYPTDPVPIPTPAAP